MSDLRQFLEQRLGLEPDSFGKNSYTPHVQEVMRKLGCSSESELLTRLTVDSQLFNDFVNRILINESWFFRDPETFDGLVEQARRHPPQEIFRILSLPCASGEEPYSAAIRLEQEHLLRYHIDALDLSETALERARRGQYGAYAFRGVEDSVRDRYFTRLSPQKWEILERFRGRIHFVRGNVAEPGFLPEHRKYDAVLCRNLLIYLTREARERLLRTLGNVLSERGELYLTACESPLAGPSLFVRGSSRYSFRLRTEAPPEPPSRPRYLPRPADFSPARPPAPPPRPSEGGPDDLVRAAELADRGMLEPALKLCEKYLSQHQGEAQAYYLSGLVLCAMGRYQEAREPLRRAVYLDPSHQDALLQSALCLERLGSLTAAALLRQRARTVGG